MDFNGHNVATGQRGPQRKNAEGDLCSSCHTRTVKKYFKPNGVTGFYKKCWKCIRSSGNANNNAHGKKRRYKTGKEDHCEECGFDPVHPCQLDVHHLDGDHENEDPANLKTVCANCHRLITWRERNPEP